MKRTRRVQRLIFRMCARFNWSGVAGAYTLERKMWKLNGTRGVLRLAAFYMHRKRGR